MTNAVVRREQDADPKMQFANIEGLVGAKRDAIVKTLPATIDPDMFINVALQAVTRTPKLLICTPQSIVKAMRDAAEIGLVPSGLLGSAYLVPYWSKQVGGYEAQFQAGYRGLIDLARRSGEVRLIEAHVVRERDDFAFAYGTEGFIRHVPYMNFTGERGPDTVDERGETKRGDLLDGGPYIAAYARAVLTSGEEQFEVMTLPEIEAIRKRSKASDHGPWVTDWAEMARKTPTRKLLKYLPLAVSALTRALELEDAAESRSDRPQQRVQAVSPARSQLAASLGVSDAPQSTESGDGPEPDNQPIPAPDEAQGPSHDVVEVRQENKFVQGDPVCGSPNTEGVPCARQADHDGAHADDIEVSSAELVWPK